MEDTCGQRKDTFVFVVYVCLNEANSYFIQERDHVPLVVGSFAPLVMGMYGLLDVCLSGMLSCSPMWQKA